MPLFFIDSNIFIYSQVRDLPENLIASRRLEETSSRGDIAVNAVILSECFHALSKFLGNQEASKRITLFLESSNVIYLTIERTTLVKAIDSQSLIIRKSTT